MGLEALRGVKTINEIGQGHGVHPVQVGQWKKAIQEQAKTLFEGKRGPKPVEGHREPEVLYSEIGKLKGELDWLKKVGDLSVLTRRAGIESEEGVPVVRQCVLAGVCRATIYAQQQPPAVDETDLRHIRLIDEEYTRHPFYGSRRMVTFLEKAGHKVNRKRVGRLMRLMGLAGMAPGPNTRRRRPEHRVYPYRLRGVAVVRPNPVWSTDITYIRLARGFAYLVAIIDWYSRKVLSWRISTPLEARFCVDCLEEALRTHGQPDLFNSDQGAQFTSEAFTNVLAREEIVISMDGRGRVFDNLFVERLWRSVKHEDVYLKGYATMDELRVGLTEYFAFYNGERPHQSLGQQTPDVVYRTALGGGAKIVEKFARAGGETSAPLRSAGVSPPAEARSTAQSQATANQTKAKPGQRRPAAGEVAGAA